MRGRAQDPIRRFACSIAANTYNSAPNRVTVSKKSQASRASAGSAGSRRTR
ncbi:hypothetical protein SHIRM173S_07530 [Streptomyces hirsutus]